MNIYLSNEKSWSEHYVLFTHTHIHTHTHEHIFYIINYISELGTSVIILWTNLQMKLVQKLIVKDNSSIRIIVFPHPHHPVWRPEHLTQATVN